MGCNGKCPLFKWCVKGWNQGISLTKIGGKVIYQLPPKPSKSGILLSKGGCFTKKYVTHMATEMNIQVILYMGWVQFKFHLVDCNLVCIPTELWWIRSKEIDHI